MKLFVCIIFHLFVTGAAWPRYGRPHPLYSKGRQANENMFANARLLGLDFNEIQMLQAVDGLDLSSLHLLSRGFPMNRYELEKARKDVATLISLGLAENLEEAGILNRLKGKRVPNPQNNGQRNGNNIEREGREESLTKQAKSKSRKTVSKQSGRIKLQNEDTRKSASKIDLQERKTKKLADNTNLQTDNSFLLTGTSKLQKEEITKLADGAKLPKKKTTKLARNTKLQKEKTTQHVRKGKKLGAAVKDQYPTTSSTNSSVNAKPKAVTAVRNVTVKKMRMKGRKVKKQSERGETEIEEINTNSEGVSDWSDRHRYRAYGNRGRRRFYARQRGLMEQAGDVGYLNYPESVNEERAMLWGTGGEEAKVSGDDFIKNLMFRHFGIGRF